MKRLEADAAPEELILPSLEQPPKWFACPRCAKDWTSEVVGQCWSCDKTDEKARATANNIKRAMIRAEHERIHDENPEIVELLMAGSTERLRARITRILNERYRCKAITITGPTGAGKTSLAILLLRARLSSALFVTSHNLASADAQHALGRGEAELLSRANSVDLLVIDELKLPALAARQEVVAGIMQDRIDRGQLTVLTHGWNEEEFIRDWGVGLHRRFYTDGNHIRLDALAQKRSAA